MAKKKNSSSKGYHKPVKKSKPFLTKKEIIALIVIVAAIALAILLFELLYDDGFLSASQIQENDIVSFASKDMKNRYLKLAEANDIDGFERQPAENANGLQTFEYVNTDETSPLDRFNLFGSYVGGSTMVDSTLAYLGALEGGAYTDKLETEVQGHQAYIFSYTYDYYQAPEEETPEEPAATEEISAAEAPAEEDEAEEPESNVFCQNMTCYVNCANDHCVGLHIYLTGEDNSFYIPDDEVEAYVMQFTDAFTLVETEVD